MSSLLAVVASLAHDIDHERHTVVGDWLDEPFLTTSRDDGKPDGLGQPVRCLDCGWTHTAHIGPVITQTGIDVAIADLHTLHNRTRPKDADR